MKLKRDLSRPTKARVKPDWPRLPKEDPVRYIVLYKADYIYTMERTNLKWNKTRATQLSIAVRKCPHFSAKKERNDLPWDLPSQANLPTKLLSSLGRSTII